MTLLERMASDLRDAMRARDLPRTRTLRTLHSAVRYAEIENRGEADDELVREVLGREARRREEAIALYREGDRPDKVEEETAELELIRAYLPPEVSRETMEQEARAVISSLGASGPADTGRVMGNLMPRLRGLGTVDGKTVSEVVRALLAG
jgi:uncharacterized protein YqeY